MGFILEGQTCGDKLGVCGHKETQNALGEPQTILGLSAQKEFQVIPANYFCVFNKIDNTMESKDYSVNMVNQSKSLEQVFLYNKQEVFEGYNKKYQTNYLFLNDDQIEKKKGTGIETFMNMTKSNMIQVENTQRFELAYVNLHARKIWQTDEGLMKLIIQQDGYQHEFYEFWKKFGRYIWVSTMVIISLTTICCFSCMMRIHIREHLRDQQTYDNKQSIQNTFKSDIDNEEKKLLTNDNEIDRSVDTNSIKSVENN